MEIVGIAGQLSVKTKNVLICRKSFDKENYTRYNV